MAKEHEPDTEVRVFMMDMRAFGKGYEEYYHRAKKKYGIEYTRCRISAVKEDPQTKNLIIRYFIDDQLREEQFDLVVLSVGMEISAEVKRLGGDLGIELDDYGFCHTALFDPLQTSRPGIYVAGPFREPKDIPETVVEASGAAAVAGELLAPARGTLTRKIEYPSERDVSGEEPRIGVFVCHCGSNIAGFLDVPTVTEYAKSLPFVVHAEHNLYTCSQDSIAQITQQVKELNLNRVVVAACTPRTHEPLFQDSLRMAGLNPHLFEMANIRNQCSWVHSHDWEVATRKAKELVRMSVARAARLESLSKVDLPLQPGALVIGGGVAGMNAALALAEQGFPVHLVERAAELGGNLRCVFYTTNGRDPQAYLREIVARVESHLLITVHRQTELTEASGFIGNFVSKLRRADGESFTVPHGVIIVATGGQEYRGTEYGYGTDPRIITQQEFEGLLARSMNQRGSESTRQRGGEAVRQPVHSSLIDSLPSSVVMIQCVGPAERYCSRICCTTALKNALKLKELNSSAQVTVLFKDIRTYGFKERLYAQAREAGVLFVRYDDAHKPHVSRNMDHVEIKVWEPALGRELVLTANLLVLSTPIVPAEGARELATVLKVPVDLDGFFLEAHIKLRPVDFASDGIFMAGLSHYPKLLDETIVQAQAAAARAATILGKDKLSVGGVVAVVEAEKCTGCLTCVRVCPYHVPQIALTRLGVGGIVGAASIEVAQCQGCGICAAECPAKAIQLMHYKDEQMRVKVEALFAGSELVTA
jgi:heterodisulfide reductase subunit A-like polyferredoxin